MRCFVCNALSFTSLCRRCRTDIVVPSIDMREVGTLRIYSLFSYSAIEALLLTKHKSEGYRLYRTLGRYYLRPFLHQVQTQLSHSFCAVGVDERVEAGYSHIAQLTRSVVSDSITTRHGVLRAQNRVRYAGKSLAYRLENPRGFRYTGDKTDVVLVDDIVTTGTTLHEAMLTVEKSGANVLFAVVLADAGRES